MVPQTDSVNDIARAAKALEKCPGDERRQRELCDAIYDSLRADVVGMAKRLLFWYQDAEMDDLLQDTLYEVFSKMIRLTEGRKFDTTRSERSLAAYINKTAKHELFDQIRARAKSAETTSMEFVLAQTAPDDPEPADINELLQSLKEADREIIQMRLVEGLAYRTIADRIGQSQETARGRYHRAIKRLRAKSQ